MFSKKVGIIGKGLLFDTGGYNIKTAMMELMKFDCGGSVSYVFNIFSYMDILVHALIISVIMTL